MGLRFLSGFLMLVLSGCATQQVDWHGPTQWVGLKDRHRLARASAWQVSPQTRVYVAQPLDSSFDTALHQTLVEAIRRYYPHTGYSQSPESLAAARSSAIQAGANLVLYPSLRRRVTASRLHDPVSWDTLRRLGGGQFDLDLGLYTAQEGLVVDQIQFESLAGLFRQDETELLWQPLDAYLRQISDY